MIPESTTRRRNRGETEIIGDFLEALKEGPQSQMGIMRRANIMNSGQFDTYSAQLLEGGFIEHADRSYSITEKGRQALDQIKLALSTLGKKGEVA